MPPTVQGATGDVEIDSVERDRKVEVGSQIAKLVANNGDSYEYFGRSVAISKDGSTLIVGAYNDGNPSRGRAGSVYVFEREDGELVQQAKLVANDGDKEDNFGSSVAISGDGTTVIVGASWDDNSNGDQTGSAYVFKRTSGKWVQQTKLIATDGDSEDRFAWSVAMMGDGTTAIVGAPGNVNSNGEKAGSAYVFSSGGEWSQEAKLIADDGDDYNYFGSSVGISGDGTTAIVGSVLDGNSNGYGAGSAYVFEQAGGKWVKQAKIAAGDGDSRDLFGRSVAMSGDGTSAIVGAYFDEDPNGRWAGSAYTFGRDGGAWTQDTKLTADDGDVPRCPAGCKRATRGFI